MVQVFAAIFFSTAALGALSVIAMSFADDLGTVRMALGLAPAVPALPSSRVRRIEQARRQAMAKAVQSVRAAA